ncbi:hypothetical protein AALC75_21015 [Lachnospiraceae bacterium 48-42]
MGETFKLNHAELKILKCLYSNGCTSQYNSMTVEEILNKDKELTTYTVVYKNLKKLRNAKCVNNGIMNGHAYTYYLLDKAIKMIEGKETETSQQTGNNTCISYDSNSVRAKLTDIMDRGLMLKSIAVNAGISESELSRFKSGVDALKESDMKLLADYLNVVYIPRWNKGEKMKLEKKKTTNRRRKVSLDLLNELES